MTEETTEFENRDQRDDEQLETKPEVSESDAGLLQQIREDFRYCINYWRENYEEAATDSQYVVGDIWTEEDKEARKGRPMVVPDELSQYTKQANNNLRQNKRAIKVDPKGMGATDKDAQRRAAIIRGIESVSSAQAIYTTAFESCTEKAFGAFRITTEYVNDEDETVEPRIRPIPNALTVLWDPKAKQADFSDQKICFVIDAIRKTDFADEWPEAVKKSFTPQDATVAPEWIQGEDIVIAEYWKVEQGDTRKIGKGRKVRDKKVMQYITNGFEILDRTEWPGSRIPIIGVFGEEKYVKKNGQTKRVFMSLIRRARDPQKMLAFVASQEAEEFGMAPRAPLVGYTGQFETDKERWQTANKVPAAYLQVDVPSDWSPAWGAPPLPQRPQFQPNIAAYEGAFERWRRSTQAAMGVTPLPTAAQRQNEKSGVALERIQTQAAIGVYHIIDNFQRALENAGWQLNELITKVMDTPRQVAARNPDDSHALMLVTPQQHQQQALSMLPEGAQDNDYLITDKGVFDVSISTGPSYESEREEASAFVDLLVQNIQALPIPPQAQAQLLAKAVKLKNVGPIGDELAKILDPSQDGEEMPPQALAALQQLKTEAQALNQQCQQYEAKIQQLEQEKQAKVIDNEYRLSIEKLKIEAQVTMAEINTKAQSLNERIKFVEDVWKQLQEFQNQQMSQSSQQQHEADMAEQAAQNAQVQQQAQLDAQAQAQQAQPAQV